MVGMLVPLKGGIGSIFITPQKAIYKWYVSGIYCQLGDGLCYRSHLLGEPASQPLILGSRPAKEVKLWLVNQPTPPPKATPPKK